MNALLIPLIPLAGSVLTAVIPMKGRMNVLLAIPFALLSAWFSADLAMTFLETGEHSIRIPWADSIGVSLTLYIDGLSVFFACVASFMGVLIFTYAGFYLDNHYKQHKRFYASLLLFLSAMAGSVLSGNLITMFAFWELTGLASFLLIGFLHEKEESMRGARMAFLTTGAGGLSLLAGFVLLGQIAGTFDLEAILGMAATGELPSSPLKTAALILILGGAFTKSAQFPFHYWLPNAMAAPAPVSAFLHSATMVKLGIFLIARVYPVFSFEEIWQPLLVAVGVTTMLLGAVLAVLSHKLKGILAYSTVSQLGLFTTMYGLLNNSVPFDFLHVANHVLYKGCLFMCAGIVEHSTGVKDVRQLGGLAKKMPGVFIIMTLALMTMSGVPFTTGFLSKELFLADSLKLFHTTAGKIVTVSVVLYSVLKVVFSIRIVADVFLKKPGDSSWLSHYHAPSAGIHISPLILVAAAIAAGSFLWIPESVTNALQVNGLNLPAKELHLWHGLTIEFFITAGVFISGILLYFVFAKSGLFQKAVTPDFMQLDLLYDKIVYLTPKFASKFTTLLQSERPVYFFWIVVMATGLIVAWPLYHVIEETEFSVVWTLETNIRIFVVGLTLLSTLIAAVLRQWIAQVIAISVSGFLLSFYYVLYRAPDLAMTQLLVESALLILVLLVLGRFPEATAMARQIPQKNIMRILKAFAGIGAGLFVTVMIYTAATHKADHNAGRYYLENTVELAEGSNAVNTILVDFRGLDTLFEINVLLIATLGCLGLLMRMRTREKGPVRQLKDTIDRLHPVYGAAGSFIFHTTVKILFFPILIYSVYLLLRGHNLPGGGFIAGVQTAVALIMLSFAIGVEKVHAMLRFDPVRIAAAGIMIAVGSSMSSVFFGDAFLDQYNFHFELPVLGMIHIGTPLIFDIGVMLVVVGISARIIFALAKSVSGVDPLMKEHQQLYSSILEEPVESEFEGAKRDAV